MSYFAPPRDPQPPVYSVDDDGDRIYTEEDYGMPADGDAFLPDEENEAELYADAFVHQPYTYTGSYESMDDTGDDWEEERKDYADYELTDEERAELRRSNWKLLAGLADFGAIILGTAVILVLIALLVSLMNWLINDVSQTFTLLQMPM